MRKPTGTDFIARPRSFTKQPCELSLPELVGSAEQRQLARLPKSNGLG